MKLTILIAIFALFASSCLDASKAKDKALVVKTMADQIQNKFSNVNVITIEDFQNMKGKQKLLLVDVREEKERKISMIPGAINKADFEKNSSKYKNHKIIAYCTIGYRSSEYAAHLSSKGFSAYNLKESALGWAHRKLKFVKDGLPTKKVHVYDDPWNLLPEGYQGVTD